MGNGNLRSVYLDNHASTRCDPRVVEDMLPFLVDEYSNASSPHHTAESVANAIRLARDTVAQTIGAGTSEIVFTSGATESNNLAILGLAGEHSRGRSKILTCSIEHKSVLASCAWIERRGYHCEIAPVDTLGLVKLDALAELLDDHVLLVSIQAANNEIGTVQPVAEIVNLAHGVGALVHCDAAQALGRIDVDVDRWGVDLASFSGHKCYGPKGIGALFVRGGSLRADLQPVMVGGGHEQGLRPGTLNTPGIVGLGSACEIIQREMEDEAKQVELLRDWFETALLSAVGQVKRNGCVESRLPGNSSLTLEGVEADVLIANLPDIALSGGSACTSESIEPSHVLTAIGLSPEKAGKTLRVGIGRFTTDSDLSYAVERIAEVVERVRRL